MDADCSLWAVTQGVQGKQVCIPTGDARDARRELRGQTLVWVVHTDSSIWKTTAV